MSHKKKLKSDQIKSTINVKNKIETNTTTKTESMEPKEKSMHQNICFITSVIISIVPIFSLIFLCFILFDIAYIFDRIPIILKASIIFIIILIFPFVIYCKCLKSLCQEQFTKYFLSYGYNVIVLSTIFTFILICCKYTNIANNYVYYEICKGCAFIFLLFSLLWIINPSLYLTGIIKRPKQLITEFLSSNDILVIKQTISQIIGSILTFFALFINNLTEIFNLKNHSNSTLGMYAFILLLYMIGPSILQIIIVQKDFISKKKILYFLGPFLIILYVLLGLFIFILS